MKDHLFKNDSWQVSLLIPAMSSRGNLERTSVTPELTSESAGASFVAYVVYGTLSFLSVAFVGLKPIFSHGLLNKLLDVCPGGPNALHYTGVDSLDQILCFLISIQHAVLEEDLKPLMRYGLAVIPVIFVFLHVESGRRTGVLVSNHELLLFYTLPKC